MVQFIGNRWVRSCDTRFKNKEDVPYLIPIDLTITGKEAIKLDFSRDVLMYNRDVIAPELMGHVAVPLRWKEFLFHRGCSCNVTSILEGGLIAGGNESREGRQTVFFTPLDSWGDEEEFNNDLSRAEKSAL